MDCERERVILAHATSSQIPIFYKIWYKSTKWIFQTRDENAKNEKENLYR